ncbi:MAG: hypothetical protein ONB16_10880, partial [candidate division KSB1 bacterium]|nr:hypothetical protein [candidate division KSB1 bacterium]
EFQHHIFEVAAAARICDVPIVRQIGLASISIRVPLTIGNFIDIFYNRQSDRIAYALIESGNRIFGADNTGGWHIHPFENPANHLPLTTAMTFAEFIKAIEQHYQISP